MTIQFKTDAVYTLWHSNASLKLICTYIEDNTVWLKSEGVGNNANPASDTTLLYKLDRKTKKLYVFNTRVQTYDLVEGSLSECSHCVGGEVTKACYDGVWWTSPCEQCS